MCELWQEEKEMNDEEIKQKLFDMRMELDLLNDRQEQWIKKVKEIEERLNV